MDDPKSAELAMEQAYFDAAAQHRDRKLSALEEAANAAAHPSAAAHLKRHADAVADALGAAGNAVAFGRTDDESGETLYIGRQLVRDDRSEVLVVSWKSPAAAAYFEANHQHPAGLRRKRIFTCDGNTIRDFTDLRFAELAAAVSGTDVPLVDPALLAELTRGRTGVLREIVATIQAAQYDVIRAPLAQVLVIEGGPGTGKTAVALHRVSYLLFHHRDRLSPSDVLVVGPHPTFMRYVSGVLPGLGEEGVVLRSLGELAPPVSTGRVEPDAVSRLKGDPRMAGVVERALAARIGEPEPAERLLIGGRFLTLPGRTVAAAVAACRAAGLPYTEGRQQLRARLVQLVTDAGGDPAAGREPLEQLLERLWPAQTAPALLRDLLGSRRRLQAAAGAELTPDELALLYRRGADRLSVETWSAADLPLLDEADHLLHGAREQYPLVVVDEAQDLSPMQLRCVARRSAGGSVTVVGDLAQATGPWAREHWHEVTDHLPGTHPVTVVPLRYGYRVPRQAYQLAAQLLPVAAAHAAAPEVVRDGPAEPVIHRVELVARAERAAAVAGRHAAAGRFVGVVCPDRCRREVAAALTAAGLEWADASAGELAAAVNLVDPYQAKGLEFDAVVVVEPELIVASDVHGHRLLYIALTRTTQFLDVVCAGEPLPLAAPAGTDLPDHVSPAEPAGDAPGGSFGSADARRLANHLAERLRSAAPPAAWPQVLELLRRELSEPPDPAG